MHVGIRSVSILLCTLLLSSCGKKSMQPQPLIVDFTAPSSVRAIDSVAVRHLNVAISSMISPRETFSYYQDLMRYISERMGMQVSFRQRKTYGEVNALLERNEVDLAFICSGAYVEAADAGVVDILAVPVTRGRTLYQAYIIVHRQSGIVRFEDLRGRSFAFTDPLSNTGYLYALWRLRELGTTPEQFFTKTLFSFAHDYSIQLVAKRLIEGATIDGLIYEYLRQVAPERVHDVLVIERSEYFGMPPIVVPKRLPADTKQKLREIFLTMASDPKGKLILDKLMIERFVEGRDADYRSVRTMRKVIRR